jgi:hypothetical protein
MMTISTRSKLRREPADYGERHGSARTPAHIIQVHYAAIKISAAII